MKLNKQCGTAFTLIELLASMAILSLIMVMLFSAFEQISKAWTQGENRVETFTQARAILDLMSRELSQAVATTKIPFSLQDKRHIYFVAPLNTDPLNQADLSEVGYEFEQGTPPSDWSFKITRRLIQPKPANIGVGGAWNPYSPTWYNSFFNFPIPSPFEDSAVLTSNSVLNVEFQYWDPGANAFVSAPSYVSTGHGNKPPTAVQIFLDVVDSRTAAKLRLVPLNTGNEWISITNSTLRSFSTIIYLPNGTP
jgi:prepilin-type N-terminal cleavage/methylation domain-containing protein